MSERNRRSFLKTVGLGATAMWTIPSISFAGSPKISFLIPGGEGGGWDTTARAVGEVLSELGLAQVTGYQNYSGAGGGRALSVMATKPEDYTATLMVQSTPLVIRAATGVYRNTWRDTQPIAAMISAYQAIAVPADSPYSNLGELVEAIRRDPSGAVLTGGSGRLSMDHLTFGLVAQGSGLPLAALRYSESDGGGDALERMLNDSQIVAIASGVGELIAEHEAGRIRILGVSSPEPLPGLDVPTFRSEGVDVVFANWRGFFTSKATDAATVEAYQSTLVTLSESSRWAEIRAQYKWEPLVLVGEEFESFLIEQEAVIETVLAQFQES